MKLLEYYFDDHSEIQHQLASIREGSGYLDMAQDLIKIATLAEAHDEVLNVDTRHYRSSDRADAHRIASRIHEELDAQSPEKLKRLQDQLNRAWTLLVLSWNETCLAGQLLFRKDQDARERFVSAYTLGRNPITRSARKTEDTDTPNDPTPLDPS